MTYCVPLTVRRLDDCARSGRSDGPAAVPSVTSDDGFRMFSSELTINIFASSRLASLCSVTRGSLPGPLPAKLCGDNLLVRNRRREHQSILLLSQRLAADTELVCICPPFLPS